METNILPKTWLFESIVATLCCCPPLGIVGIVYAMKVDSLFAAERYEESLQASNRAKNLFIASLCIGIVLWIIASVIFWTKLKESHL